METSSGTRSFRQRQSIDPLRQAADAREVDPGEQHQQGHGRQLTGTTEHLGVAHVTGEPGEDAGEVLQQGQHFDRW